MPGVPPAWDDYDIELRQAAMRFWDVNTPTECHALIRGCEGINGGYGTLKGLSPLGESIRCGEVSMRQDLEGSNEI
jgi:hypothetical protein